MVSPRSLTRDEVSAVSARLSNRDLAVLKWISDLRFVSGSQLTRLCFMDGSDPMISARTSRRSLLRLTRLELLARLPRRVGGVRSGSAGFIYRLGIAGQRLAEVRGWQPERPRRRSLVPGSLFLEHTLQVAELHARLTEAERSGRIELLELAAEPLCWRYYFDGLGGQRECLKPDSYVRLGIGPYEDSSFVEVDRGTIGSRTIERQMAVYASYHRTGLEQDRTGVFPRVVWLANTAERMRTLNDCIERQPSEERALFVTGSFDDALTVLADGGSTSVSQNDILLS